MKDHEIILKMIKEVAQDDNAKLDEIDALLYLFLYWPEKIQGAWWPWSDNQKENIDFIITRGDFMRYTRSRDALLTARPPEWTFDIFNTIKNGANCNAQRMLEDGEIIYLYSPLLATEMLTELHAIVQAIAYNRGL